MTEVPFVKKEHGDIARSLEDKILQAPGVLFVGVSVDPTVKDEEPTFHIWIGCDRSMNEDTVSAAIGMLIQLDSALGFVKYMITTKRGRIST